MIIAPSKGTTMFAAFENLRTVTRTQTNGRLFLDDPATKNGEFKRLVNVMFEGTMEVTTQRQILTAWGESAPLYALPWIVNNMPSEGKSDLGIIKLTGHPDMLSTGVIRQNAPNQSYPATLEAAVHQVFDIPGYGKLHNKYPVVVEGTVDSVPPLYTACACRCALLYDENDQPRGLIGGRVLTILPQ
jgi:hypothetical protein